MVAFIFPWLFLWAHLSLVVFASSIKGIIRWGWIFLIFTMQMWCMYLLSWYFSRVLVFLSCSSISLVSWYFFRFLVFLMCSGISNFYAEFLSVLCAFASNFKTQINVVLIAVIALFNCMKSAVYFSYLFMLIGPLVTP